MFYMIIGAYVYLYIWNKKARWPLVGPGAELEVLSPRDASKEHAACRRVAGSTVPATRARGAAWKTAEETPAPVYIGPGWSSLKQRRAKRKEATH